MNTSDMPSSEELLRSLGLPVHGIRPLREGQPLTEEEERLVREYVRDRLAEDQALMLDYLVGNVRTWKNAYRRILEEEVLGARPASRPTEGFLQVKDRVASWNPVLPPSAEEKVCLGVLAAAEHAGSQRPLPVRDFHTGVKPHYPGRSLNWLRDVAATAVSKGLLKTQEYASGCPPRTGASFMSGPDANAAASEEPVIITAYRLAHTPEELLACVAHTLAESGSLTPQAREELQDLADVLGVPEEFRQQMVEWLATV